MSTIGRGYSREKPVEFSPDTNLPPVAWAPSVTHVFCSSLAELGSQMLPFSHLFVGGTNPPKSWIILICWSRKRRWMVQMFLFNWVNLSFNYISGAEGGIKTVASISVFLILRCPKFPPPAREEHNIPMFKHHPTTSIKRRLYICQSVDFYQRGLGRSICMVCSWKLISENWLHADLYKLHRYPSVPLSIQPKQSLDVPLKHPWCCPSQCEHGTNSLNKWRHVIWKIELLVIDKVLTKFCISS